MPDPTRHACIPLITLPVDNSSSARQQHASSRPVTNANPATAQIGALNTGQPSTFQNVTNLLPQAGHKPPKATASWVKRCLCLSDTSFKSSEKSRAIAALTLFALVVAIIGLGPGFGSLIESQAALDLAKWEALKDFIGDCRDRQERNETICTDCNEALSTTLPLPPHVQLSHVARSLKTLLLESKKDACNASSLELQGLCLLVGLLCLTPFFITISFLAGRRSQRNQSHLNTSFTAEIDEGETALSGGDPFAPSRSSRIIKAYNRTMAAVFNINQAPRHKGVLGPFIARTSDHMPSLAIFQFDSTTGKNSPAREAKQEKRAATTRSGPSAAQTSRIRRRRVERPSMIFNLNERALRMLYADDNFSNKHSDTLPLQGDTVVTGANNDKPAVMEDWAHFSFARLNAEWDTVLTLGSLQEIFGENPPRHPVLQCLQVKQLSVETNPERFRIVVSDVQNFAQCLLSTDCNHFVRNGLLQRGAVLRLISFSPTEVKGKKIIVVLDL